VQLCGAPRALSGERLAAAAAAEELYSVLPPREVTTMPGRAGELSLTATV